MHCRRYHNIHCLWNSRFVPCAFDCAAERRLLLHTPTFSARPGVDGLETFFLFFTHHCFFKDGDWRCSVLNPSLYCIDGKDALLLMRGIKVDLWSHLVSVAIVQNITYSSQKAAYARISIAAWKHLKCFIVGVAESKGDEERENIQRHSTSLLK